MALPNVKIHFENGALGASLPSDDGVIGVMASGVAVAGKFGLGTAYMLTRQGDLAELGITGDDADGNRNIYKTVKEIYSEAPAGTKVWLMACANTVSMADMVNPTGNYARTLVESARGTINLLVVSKTNNIGYTPTILDGLDADVYAAMTNAQALGQWAAESKYAPLMTILPGMRYSGVASELRNLAEGNNNRVCILIADTESGSGNACVGLLAGRIAAIPVQRSVARVKSGAVASDSMYIGDRTAENGNPDVIHDSGFITARTMVGKAGYYWSDDKLATSATDDYALIPRRRVIDKAYRIAYQTMVEELGDEVPVADDGTLPPTFVKSLQNKVETAIENRMTAYGNLGNDPGDAKDTGVVCYIDHRQNIVALSRLSVSLKVKPHGYNKYIDIYLGFKTA